MAKIHNLGNTDPMQPQQNQTQVDISQSKPMVCSCGHDVYIQGTKFRTISKLLTGAAQDMIIPIEVFLCGNCGEINKALYPKELDLLDE